MSMRTLPANGIDVWYLDFASAGRLASRLAGTLTADESARAARFRFDDDRVRYVVARGALRDVLGRYLGRPPADLRFDYRPRGKPVLAGAGVSFNLSHTKTLAAIAVTAAREIGIDVECSQPGVEYREIAERYFTAEEMAALGRIADDDYPGAFLSAWTRKEAYLKATGVGIGDLEQIAVTLTPGEEARILRAPDADRWSMVALDPPLGHAGALVVERGPTTVRAFSWPDDLQ